MYGLVNQAIRDLVIQKAGAEAWDAICSDAKIDIREFVALQTYPDTITYQLVGSVSKALGAQAEDVLKLFGKYWVLYTAQQGYGELMDMFGSSFEKCLENLNNMHARMGTMMPHFVPPRFETEALNDRELRVEYFSKREGLGPMVYGLLEGLGEKFGHRLTITYTPRTEKNGADVFHIIKEMD